MLSVNEIYQARKFLNESQWKGFESEGGSNETDINFSRYISGVPETQIDGLLEFIRRYVSVKNAFFDVVATRAAGGAGSYRWTEEVVNGFPVFRMVGGTFSFQVVDVAGDLRWALYDGLSVVEQSTSDAMGGDPSVSVIGATWPVLSGELGVTDEEISARSVVDPQVNNGKIRQGLWRNGSVRQMKDLDGRFGDKGGWVLVQELMLELNVVAPIAVDDTRWRIKNLEAFRSGSRNIVLELPYCDPTDLQAMVDENTNAVYDSEIYTINGGVLEGKWYRQDIQSVVDPQTGYGTLLWMLRSHTNDDMGFVYMAAKCERHLQFYKSHLAADGIQDFRDQYYFDISGSFYVSADGVNYTAKDGQPATGTLPSTAKNLDEYDEARAIVDYSVVPNERTGEVDVRVHIVWKVCFVSDGVRTFVSADEIETRILLSDVTESEKDDFFDHTYYDAEGHWYYSADGTSYTRKDGETASGTLPASATLLNVWMEGRKIRVQESFSDVSKRWSVLVVALFGQIDSRTAISNAPAFYPSKDVKVTLSKGFNYSYSELMALSSAVVPAGTERQFEYERLENGRYNWVDVLSVRTGFQVSFELGDRKYDIGNHMVKPPTTDTGASPSEYTIVAVDGVSNEQVDYNDEDGTWSWIIVSVSGRDDVGFVYMAAKCERHLQFYKSHLAADGIQDFRDQYYFDISGSFYVSADGVNYTAKDGQPATGTLPSTAKNLDEYDEARAIVDYSVVPNERTGEVDVRVHIVWKVCFVSDGVRTFVSADEIETRILLSDVTESEKDDFFDHTYYDAEGHWYYSADGTSYTRKDGETASGTLPASATLLNVWMEGRKIRVQESFSDVSKRWSVLVVALFGQIDSRTAISNAPAFYPSKDVKVTLSKGFNYSYSELMALSSAVVPAGTERQFEYERLENGRYNWVDVLSVRTGFQVSFELGDRKYDIGNHMVKPPTTDTGASPSEYTIVAVDGVSNEQVDYNDEDGTWSWIIVSVSGRDDVGFVYMANRRERHLQFYKMNLESDKIQDFRDQYYFDSDGSFYVSADGVNYTAKDGQPATGTLPSTAKNLDEDADGRTIPVYTANPDDRTGLQDVHVHFIWRVGNAEEGVRTESEYGTITTQLSLEDVTESVKDGFFANTYFDESGHWYYSTDGTNYTRKDGETASGALPADAKLLDELQEGRTVRVQQSLDATSDFWNVDILAQFGDADSRTDNWSDGNATPTFYPSKDVKVTIDKGFNYTHDHLIALNTAGSSAGYKIQFEYDRLPNGRYNWVKVVSYRTGFQMSFELGDKVYHIGDHMAKPPNTDSTASSATYTIISVDGVADELVDYNDEDGTWSWKIVSEKDKDEPSGSATFIVEFGEADQWVQLVSEVSSTSLPNGGVPDLGEFKNVTITDLAGTSKTLTGRAKTVTRYDNFSVKDKKYSYRKLRLGYNAPLAPTTTVAITAVEKVYFSDKMDAVLVEYTTPTHALAVGDELFFIDSLVYPYEPTPAKILAKSGTTYRLERPFVKDDPSATGHVPYMKLDDSSIHYYDVTSFALAEDTSKVKLVGDFLHSPVMPGEKIKVTGTSDYDGTHTVLESAPSYVVIAETFTSTKTGTGTLQEDGWFFVAGGYSIDREKRTYKLDGDFDDDDNPKVTEIATRAWRKIFTQQVQKLFVRRPTPADLVAAGIEPAEAPKNELGPTVKDGVVQLSQHLFSYERVITTASKRESEVVDVPMVSIVQSYKTPE